jgi:rare lipoprotein A
MIKIVRGIIIPGGILLVFLMLTACSTDGIFAKKEKVNQRPVVNNNALEKEEYIYDEEALNVSESEARYSSNAKSGKLRDGKNPGTKEYDSPENDNYYQMGYASWYGREFDGRKTASGERYDMNKLTAAHRTLPFGTKILVKNLENDKTVTVTVNDRGPYKDSRILDLSYAAAKKIGIVSSGEANVGIIVAKNGNEEKLAGKKSNKRNDINPVVGINRDDEDNNDESVEDSRKGAYSIQAGAFYSRKNAEKLQKRLEGLVENPVVLLKDKDLYKVKIDSLSSRKDADKVKRMLEKEEIPSYVTEGQR